MIATEIFDNRWSNLCKLGGIASFVIVLILIGEILVYAIIPDRSAPNEIIALFQQAPLAGLLFFDLLGMISYILFIPLIISLYVVLRKLNETIMILATLLFLIGVAVFFANNTGFSVLSLSHQFDMARTQEEMDMILAACQTMITTFDVNAFMISYVIVSAAWTMIAFVMLRSTLFSGITAYAGILAGLSGIIAEILENTSKALLMVAISFYFAAIIFLGIWVFFTGKRLMNLAKIQTKLTEKA